MIALARRRAACWRSATSNGSTPPVRELKRRIDAGTHGGTALRSWHGASASCPRRCGTRGRHRRPRSPRHRHLQATSSARPALTELYATPARRSPRTASTSRTSSCVAARVACFLQVNWVTPVKIRSLAVTGNDGYAEVEYVTQQLAYYKAQQVPRIDLVLRARAVQRRGSRTDRVRPPRTSRARAGRVSAGGARQRADIVSGQDARASMAIAIQAGVASER